MMPQRFDSMEFSYGRGAAKNKAPGLVLRMSLTVHVFVGRDGPCPTQT